ncbi:MAG: class I SAM-dependent methyltransferase [Vicinamibacterales bacterium]
MSEPDPATRQALLQTVERYYADRLREFGATARGVDWNSAESQALRFAQLLHVLPAGADASTSLLDLGCGYGALLDTLRARGSAVSYRGYDISADMIAAATARHGHDTAARFSTELAAFGPSDVAVASGVFNVKLDTPVDTWHDYVWATIDTLHAVSTRGFAFNMLSTYSDPDRRKASLYYADPCAVFDRCKRTFSTQVALLHDTPLFEFTIVVRK